MRFTGSPNKRLFTTSKTLQILLAPISKNLTVRSFLERKSKREQKSSRRDSVQLFLLCNARLITKALERIWETALRVPRMFGHLLAKSSSQMVQSGKGMMLHFTSRCDLSSRNASIILIMNLRSQTKQLWLIRKRREPKTAYSRLH